MIGRKESPPPVDSALIDGIRVFKFKNLPDHVQGEFVKLAISPNRHVLFWRSSTTDEGEEKESDAIFVDEIVDVFIGCPNESTKPKDDARIKRVFAGTFTTAACVFNDCFVTVMFGKDFVNPHSMVFLADSNENAKLWSSELRRLSLERYTDLKSTFYYWQRLISKVQYTMPGDSITVKQLLDSIFPSARLKEEKKYLEKSLLKHVPILKEKKRVTQALLEDEVFVFTLYKEITGRHEVEEIFKKRFSSDTISSLEFRVYINKFQRDSRLNEVLYPMLAEEGWTKIADELNIGDHLNCNDFLRYLTSPYNLALRKDRFTLKEEDMHKPISHYFINSSHNTYLKGKQMKSRSAVSMYRYALLAGCRSVELDCWDGPNNEPMITHGPTHICFCTTILFRDVIQAIAETAFVTSAFPVILSFENHCSFKQQSKMAQYCKEIFGDLLLTDTLPDYPIEAGVNLPSPYVLRRKILIKNKKIERKPNDIRRSGSSRSVMVNQQSTDSGGTEDEAVERSVTRIYIGDSYEADQIVYSANNNNHIINNNGSPHGSIREKEKEEGDQPVGTELSDLVNYMRAMGKFTSFVEADTRQISSEMYSMNETKAIDLLKQHAERFVNHNKRQITRVFPRGSRVDSSNFMPMVFWNCGCQMAAVNLQTADVPNQVNFAFFEQNGKSGYILKPPCMRRQNVRFDPFEVDKVENVVPNSLTITIISGQLFNLVSDRKLSTYVEVDLYGLPSDSCKKLYKTKTVPNEGLNPVFYDKPANSTFKFDKIILPEMAYLRLTVMDESQKMIGQRLLPVTALQPGYRHVLLRNAFNRPLGPVSLFVHIDVQDYVCDAHRDLVDALQNPILAMNKVKALETVLENPTEFASRVEQNKRLLEVLESIGKGSPMSEFSTSIDANDDSFEKEPGGRLEKQASFDRVSMSGFETDISTPHTPISPTSEYSFHKNSSEKKHIALSELVASKSDFYLQQMVVSMPSLEKLENHPKVAKHDKMIRKKYPRMLEAVAGFGEHNSYQLIADDVRATFDRSVVQSIVKFSRDKNEALLSVVEMERKKLHKRIDMTHDSELKSINKINQKSRLEETSGIDKRVNPNEYRRISEKYVRRGVEENRKLQSIRNKRISELNDQVNGLRLEANVRMEETIHRVNQIFSK
ncbi:hypothetical protein L596_011554 [Steinernema carpocapsae]|uniref:1-phosphatidylinositol 4,5-bisphosphate phosphodiesterase n=1 Tax=Steinernema carpocapsae TaxID=34508 RepID=A0A4U5NV70_STECR|nr:hypothetical protein L596_011554 [Steinernema carpocapsae]